MIGALATVFKRARARTVASCANRFGTLLCSVTPARAECTDARESDMTCQIRSAHHGTRVASPPMRQGGMVRSVLQGAAHRAYSVATHGLATATFSMPPSEPSKHCKPRRTHDGR